MSNCHSPMVHPTSCLGEGSVGVVGNRYGVHLFVACTSCMTKLVRGFQRNRINRLYRDTEKRVLLWELAHIIMEAEESQNMLPEKR